VLDYGLRKLNNFIFFTRKKKQVFMIVIDVIIVDVKTREKGSPTKI